MMSSFLALATAGLLVSANALEVVSPKAGEMIMSGRRVGVWACGVRILGV